MNKKYSVELTAPAGSFESLRAAIKAGADSVYFGVDKLNMRARATKPFTLKNIKEISEICSDNGKQSYLALNTLIYDHELDEMRRICDAAKASGISALIATDWSVIRYANHIGFPVHISTQANISNMDAVRFFSQYADVVVLARELKLEDIGEICTRINEEDIRGPSGQKLRIEIFAHGALCVSVSGKCYMSLALTGHSANRGDCLQTCRRSYRVTDTETGDELKIDNRFVMSPRDLCTIGFLDHIIESGVRILKIEGRGRGPEYVYTVTKAYRQAVDTVTEGSFSQDKAEKWIRDLESVFNRGFWHGGYYLGHPLGEWSESYGSRATKQKYYLGRAVNYFRKNNVAQFELLNGPLEIGESIIVTGPTTGLVETVVTRLFADDKPVDKAVKGQSVTFPFPEKVRPNDKLFAVRKRNDWQK